MPNVEQTEIGDDNIKDDFKNIIEQISIELNLEKEKIKEITKSFSNLIKNT